MPQKVHPQTRKAIIREHEKNTRITIAVNARKMIVLDLAMIRAMDRFKGGTGELVIEMSPPWENCTGPVIEMEEIKPGFFVPKL